MSMSRTSSVDDACNDPGPIYTQIAARNSSTSILGSSRPITHCSGTWNWTLHMAKWRVPTSDSSSVALKDKEHVAHGEQALRESELQLAASGPAEGDTQNPPGIGTLRMGAVHSSY